MSVTKVVRVEDVDNPFAVLNEDGSNSKLVPVYQTSSAVQGKVLITKLTFK